MTTAPTSPPAPPTSAPTASALDLTNIQGDILSGLPKKTQTYIFFQITNPRVFRNALTHLVPLITSTAQVVKDRNTIADHKKSSPNSPELLDITGINIAFSQKGLFELGILDDLQDPLYRAGQLADSATLGDKGTGDATKGQFVPDWIPAFKDGVIHGVILLSGPSHDAVNAKRKTAENIFSVNGPKASLKEVLVLVGDVRPGKEKGHEHFGFLDGISEPAVEGFDTSPNPGQETVPQGITLVGRTGDAVQGRPAWATDGSFLAIRYLSQFVPEFDKFLNDNPIVLPGLSREKGSELLGARLMGRWKSGAPIDLTPLQDDPVLAADPSKNNNFRFASETDSQTRCPFAAHIRKTNPRADLEDKGIPTTPQRIIRRGIQFGPEVTQQERQEQKTQHDRGLIFACYQSNIGNGFHFIQTNWANNTGFIFGTTNQPGFDPIIGQAPDAGPRQLSGTNPNAAANTLALPANFVAAQGGEYFFSPSITALRDTLALASA